jgi:hypothetical protein
MKKNFKENILNWTPLCVAFCMFAGFTLLSCNTKTPTKVNEAPVDTVQVDSTVVDSILLDSAQLY